jgi:hypothetical protein
MRAKAACSSSTLSVKLPANALKKEVLDLSAYAGMWLESGNRPAKFTETSPAIYKLRPNPEQARLPLFSRKGWKMTRFEDVVENVNETDREPVEAGIDRFIGLEHLEPGSLHIQAWGNVADGITFIRRCRPGHVLFGKRRAYQCKVAVTVFERVGIRRYLRVLAQERSVAAGIPTVPICTRSKGTDQWSIKREWAGNDH